MKELVLITGAGGMVAQQLAKQLKHNYSIRFLTRTVNKNCEFQWDIQNKSIDTSAFIGVNHIVHLAGASVSKKRWTKKRKKEILTSRIDSATLIQNELIRQNIVVDSFISASAIGFYGNETTNEVYSEASSSGKGFLSDVCQKWEQVAKSFESNKTAKRISILRIGIVLSKQEGLLKKIMPLTKFNLSAVLGNGKQYISWIHISDLCRMIKFILDNKHISGTFNAVSPEHITNTKLTKAIAKAMNRNILLPNVPKFIIRLFMGEISSLFIEGTRVKSDKIRSTGFVFKYFKFSDALDNLINYG